VSRAGAAVTFSASTWQQPMPPSATPAREHLVGEVARLVVGCAPGRVRVAVDGYTAAGKTTFGHELATAVAGRGRPAFRASLDDFKRPWREAHLYDRVSGEGYYRNAQDVEAVRRLLLDAAGRHGTGTVALCSIDPINDEVASPRLIKVPG
jgi:uridine kinase